MQPVVIEVGFSRGMATVVIRGELDLVTIPAVADRLAVILRRKPRRLVIDLAGVKFMDCASARVIVGAGQFLPDGRLTIRQPSPAVLRLLELTGLDATCEIEG